MQYLDVSEHTSSAVTRHRNYLRSLIVLHTSMGRDSLSWLQGGSVLSGKPASADFLIDRQGNVFQITKPYWYAFHTGRAYYRGMQEMDGTLNQKAVGIEFEAQEQDGERITDLQVIAGAKLIGALLSYHGLSVGDVSVHSVIALPQGRKNDPYFLDWLGFLRELRSPSVESEELVIPAVLP